MDFLKISLWLFLVTISSINVSDCKSVSKYQVKNSRRYSGTNSDCFCFKTPGEHKKVPEIMNQKKDNLIRIVVYLYKDKSTGQVKMYIPNKDKQALIPDLAFEVGDKLNIVDDGKTVIDVFNIDSRPNNDNVDDEITSHDPQIDDKKELSPDEIAQIYDWSQEHPLLDTDAVLPEDMKVPLNNQDIYPGSDEKPHTNSKEVPNKLDSPTHIIFVDFEKKHNIDNINLPDENIHINHSDQKGNPQYDPNNVISVEVPTPHENNDSTINDCHSCPNGERPLSFDNQHGDNWNVPHGEEIVPFNIHHGGSWYVPYDAGNMPIDIYHGGKWYVPHGEETIPVDDQHDGNWNVPHSEESIPVDDNHGGEWNDPHSEESIPVADQHDGKWNVSHSEESIPVDDQHDGKWNVPHSEESIPVDDQHDGKWIVPHSEESIPVVDQHDGKWNVSHSEESIPVDDQHDGKWNVSHSEESIPVDDQHDGKWNVPHSEESIPVDDQHDGKWIVPHSEESIPVVDQHDGKWNVPHSEESIPVDDQHDGKWIVPHSEESIPVDDQHDGKWNVPHSEESIPVDDQHDGKWIVPHSEESLPVVDQHDGKWNVPHSEESIPVDDQHDGKWNVPHSEESIPVDDQPDGKWIVPHSEESIPVDDQHDGKWIVPHSEESIPVDDQHDGKWIVPHSEESIPVVDQHDGKWNVPHSEESIPVDDQHDGKWIVPHSEESIPVGDQHDGKWNVPHSEESIPVYDQHDGKWIVPHSEESIPVDDQHDGKWIVPHSEESIPVDDQHDGKWIVPHSEESIPVVDQHDGKWNVPHSEESIPVDDQHDGKWNVPHSEESIPVVDQHDGKWNVPHSEESIPVDDQHDGKWNVPHSEESIPDDNQHDGQWDIPHEQIIHSGEDGHNHRKPIIIPADDNLAPSHVGEEISKEDSYAEPFIPNQSNEKVEKVYADPSLENIEDNTESSSQIDREPINQLSVEKINTSDENQDGAVENQKPHVHSDNDYETFDRWFIQQMKRFQTYSDHDRAINLQTIERYILKILHDNDMHVTDEGVLTDSFGTALDVHNLHLRPILIGNTVAFGNILQEKATDLVMPANMAYLQAILVTNSNPSMILGIIPIGKTVIPSTAANAFSAILKPYFHSKKRRPGRHHSRHRIELISSKELKHDYNDITGRGEHNKRVNVRRKPIVLHLAKAKSGRRAQRGKQGETVITLVKQSPVIVKTHHRHHHRRPKKLKTVKVYKIANSEGKEFILSGDSARAIDSLITSIKEGKDPIQSAEATNILLAALRSGQSILPLPKSSEGEVSDDDLTERIVGGNAATSSGVPLNIKGRMKDF